MATRLRQLEHKKKSIAGTIFGGSRRLNTLGLYLHCVAWLTGI